MNVCLQSSAVCFLFFYCLSDSSAVCLLLFTIISCLFIFLLLFVWFFSSLFTFLTVCRSISDKHVIIHIYTSAMFDCIQHFLSHNPFRCAKKEKKNMYHLLKIRSFNFSHWWILTKYHNTSFYLIVIIEICAYSYLKLKRYLSPNVQILAIQMLTLKGFQEKKEEMVGQFHTFIIKISISVQGWC